MTLFVYDSLLYTLELPGSGGFQYLAHSLLFCMCPHHRYTEYPQLPSSSNIFYTPNQESKEDKKKKKSTFTPPLSWTTFHCSFYDPRILTLSPFSSISCRTFSFFSSFFLYILFFKCRTEHCLNGMYTIVCFFFGRNNIYTPDTSTIPANSAGEVNAMRAAGKYYPSARFIKVPSAALPFFFR